MSFIQITSAIWYKVTSSNHFDLYQFPAYCKIEANVLQGVPLAWHSKINGNDFIIPLIEREIFTPDHLPFFDLTSPYGYPGIICPAKVTMNEINEAFITFHQEASQSGYVSTFIRLHPLYNNFSLVEVPNATQVFHGSTVSVALNKSMHDIRAQYSTNHKRNLKKNHLAGYKTQLNNWNRLDEFISIYLDTMQRKKAAKRYFFARDYFLRLKRIPSVLIFLVTVTDKNDSMAAGGIFSLINGLAQFHLGGTSSAHLHLSPSKLMMDAAIVALKEAGADTLHLGGGYGSSNADGLFRFKAGYGQQLNTFSTLRFIHNPEVYNKLTAISASHGVNNAGTHFPVYRNNY
jgi:hypothetical protein